MTDMNSRGVPILCEVHPEIPLTTAQLQQKMANCLTWRASELDARVLMHAASDFPDMAVRAVMKRLRSAGDSFHFTTTEKL